MLSPNDIQKKEFKNSFRGYNKAEVNSFITQITETLQTRMLELENLSKEILELKKELEGYKKIEDTMSKTLLIAKQSADDLITSAKKKEEIIMKETDFKVDEKLRKGEVQILELQKKTDEMRLKYESERIRIKNFFKAQLALMDDEIPTIEDIKESSKHLLSRRKRSENAEVIYANKTMQEGIIQIVDDDAEKKSKSNNNEDLPNLNNI